MIIRKVKVHRGLANVPQQHEAHDTITQCSDWDLKTIVMRKHVYITLDLELIQSQNDLVPDDLWVTFPDDLRRGFTAGHQTLRTQKEGRIRCRCVLLTLKAALFWEGERKKNPQKKHAK